MDIVGRVEPLHDIHRVLFKIHPKARWKRSQAMKLEYEDLDDLRSVILHNAVSKSKSSLED